ncbi:hypothetical protein GCM10010376_85510 [Streptomyces violaceusniger]
MSFAGDEEAVGALCAGCAYPSFGERVGPWALRRCQDDGCVVAIETSEEDGLHMHEMAGEQRVGL